MEGTGGRAADAGDRAFAHGAAHAAHARRTFARPGATVVKEIFAIIGEINRAGVTVLLVERNTRQALALSRRGYVLESGRVVLVGSGEELLSNEHVRAPIWACEPRWRENLPASFARPASRPFSDDGRSSEALAQPLSAGRQVSYRSPLSLASWSPSA